MKSRPDLAKRVVAQWAREKRVARRADFLWRRARSVAILSLLLVTGAGFWAAFKPDQPAALAAPTETPQSASPDTSSAEIGTARYRVLGVTRGRQSVSGQRVRRMKDDLTRLNNRLDRRAAGMP